MEEVVGVDMTVLIVGLLEEVSQSPSISGPPAEAHTMQHNDVH